MLSLTRYPQPTEETKSTWVPSYSVRSQGSSPLHTPQEITDDVAEIETLPAPAVEAEVPSEESPAPSADAAVPVEEAPAPAAEVEAEVEATPLVEEAAPPVIAIEEPTQEIAVAEVPMEETPVIVTEPAADEVSSVCQDFASLHHVTYGFHSPRRHLLCLPVTRGRSPPGRHHTL